MGGKNRQNKPGAGKRQRGAVVRVRVRVRVGIRVRIRIRDRVRVRVRVQKLQDTRLQRHRTLNSDVLLNRRNMRCIVV
jgi:hypothetical protein